MKSLFIFIAIVFNCFVFAVNAAAQLSIEITKSKQQVWTISYSVDQTVKQLGFNRNPDHSRAARWKPLSDAFEIVYRDQEEFIVKKDGTLFSNVQFRLTPTYIALPKDYAPFSPFSDGGILLHSGRFFACVDSCDEQDNQWHMSLSIPDDEHIIFSGKSYLSSVDWQDKDSGQSLYVGKQKPIETGEVVAIIDEGLPKAIKEKLTLDIPKLMSYFRERLGRLKSENKPTLYASYAKVNGHSSQGGVLPNQVFMHWNLNDLEEKVEDTSFVNDISWFFAHEIAHLFQGDLDHENKLSWLHEGNADLLASLVSLSLYPESKSYVDSRFKEAKAHCVKGLKQLPLVDAADNGQFGLYYTCGLLIHEAINEEVKRFSHDKYDIYTIWNEYRNQIVHGKPAGQATFLAIVDTFTNGELSAKIEKLVNVKQEDPDSFIHRFTGHNALLIDGAD